ncbi:SDR family NAD(P)-dependent oxidoreductase [Alsobacter sp. R-9]
MLLSGKTILVTGAAAQRGIGRAVCRLGAQHGADVIALDVDDEGLTSIRSELPGLRDTLRCDLSEEGDCQAAAEHVAALGGCDALVHCAGIAEPMFLAELDRGRFDRMIDVNLWGTLQICRAIAPGMAARRSGSIICLSSLAAQRGGGFVGGLHYTASKAAVLGVVKSLSRELGPSNVRVNAVCPGLVDTDMTAPFMSPDVRAQLAKQALLGRMATAEEIAGVCLFLASDLSAYVTGATIDVNGGLHIH